MFNYFDIIVLGVVGLSVYFGFQTGIIASIFYILSGFVGLFFAQKYCPEPNMNFYIVFAAGAGAVVLIGFFVSKLCKNLLLGTFDRVGGVILGLVLGLVMVGSVVFPVSYHLPKSAQAKVTQSIAGKKVIPFFQGLFPKVKQFKFSELTDKLPEVTMPEIKFKKDK